MKHILFLCSKNKLRSPTAEFVFAGHPGIDVDSAGLANDAEIIVSEEQIEWADLILVMEKAHRAKLNQRFGHALGNTRIAVLGIPDNYEFMDDELVRILKLKCAPYLP